MTELIGDIMLICIGGTAQPTGTAVPTVDISLNFNTNVTSRGLVIPASEALLLLDEPGSGQPSTVPGFGSAATQILCSYFLGAVTGGCVEYARDVSIPGATVQVAANSAAGTLSPGANVFQGIVTNQNLTFHGVPILAPAVGSQRVIRITNVRVNAPGLPGGGLGFPAVTASVTTTNSAVTVNVTNLAQTVGTVQPGLAANVRDANNLATLPGGGAGFTQCAGSTSPVPVAMLRFTENFGTAFVTRVAPTSTYSGQSGAPVQQNVPGATYNSESGFFFPAASNNGMIAGLADYGTRLKASFNNIPAGARVFVSVTNLASNTSSPNTPAPSGISTSPYAALIQGESAVDANGIAPFTTQTTTVNGSATGLAELQVTNGAATAVWEVINTNPNASETFQFGAWQQFAANGPPLGTATVNLSFAPTFPPSLAATTASSLAVARFADTSSSANLLSITACSGQTKATSTIALVPSTVSANAGQTVTLNATVTPSTATGTVTFFDGTTAIGNLNLNNGIASVSTSFVAVGSHSLTAQYNGDGAFNGSTSLAIAVTVAAGHGTTTTGVTAFPTPASVGQTVTLSATVIPTTATGTITFKDGAVTLSTVPLANGSALTTASLALGSHTITASYNGDANNSASTSGTFTEVINPPTTPTTASLFASPNPAATGQAVTLLATVSPISATGSVTFKDGTGTIGTVTLSNGSATLPTSSLTAGSHSLTVLYNGSLTYSQSTSVAVTEVVNPSVVTVTISASPNPAITSQTVTLILAVSPASATGTVSVLDTSTSISLGAATLSGGNATITTSTLKVGSHSFQATYSGDAINAAAKSAMVIETVNSPTTTTALSAAPAASSPGQTVVLTATVTPSAATGTVLFKDGATTLGAVMLASGIATLSTSTLAAGSHTVTASYSGDGNYAASASNPIIETVGLATTCVAFPVGFVPFSSVASISQPDAAGDLLVVGNMSLTDFATYQSLPLPAGPNQQFCGTVLLAPGIPVTAYVPTAVERTGNFGPFAGLLIDPLAGAPFPGGIIPSSRIPDPLAWRISALLQTSTTTLSVTPNPSTPGQSVTLTAMVTPSSATGTVTFLDGSTILQTAALSAGTATFTTSALAAGSHSLTASYAGDSKNGGSISNPVTETVGVSAATTTTTLTITPASSTLGQAVNLAATVSPASATGSVTFKDGPTLLQTVALNGGTASFTTSTLATGSHSLTAAYSGDSKNGASTSMPITESVGASPPTTTTTTLSVTPASSTPGQAVTLTATVSPASATGSVTFLDGSSILQTVALNTGTANFTTSALASGSHSLTVAYSGDSRNGASTSQVVTESVGLSAPSTTTLTVTPASSTPGQAVTLTATVSPASATGSVTFLDGSTILQTVALNAGTATFTTSTLATGSHSLTAAYSGDSRNGAGTSMPVTETVSKLTSTIVLSASPTSSSPAQVVTLTANVTPSGATGSVAFLDSQTILGTITLAGGAAVFKTSTLAAGSHALSASYSGDSRYGASISPSLVETVGSANALQIASPSPATAFVSVAWSQTFKATGGTAPYNWTLPSNSMPDLAMTASGDTAVVSGTPGTPGAYQLTVRVQDSSSQSSTAPLSLTVYPLPVVKILATPPATPADQPAPQLSLAQAYPFALAGTFTLSFAPNAPGLPVGYNDVQFPAGGTTFAVTIPANSTTPNPPISPIQLGSVAGDIIGTLGPLTTAGAQSVPFPGPSPNVKITVPVLPPIIVPGSVRIINVTASGFQVFLDASSTTRDLTSGAFVFTAATGTQMNGCTPNCTVSFATEAAAWFASAAGVLNGGTTSLTVPFTFSGDTSVINTVVVTLTNSVGTSASVSGGK